jgi:hypothetical protein
MTPEGKLKLAIADLFIKNYNVLLWMFAGQ